MSQAPSDDSRTSSEFNKFGIFSDKIQELSSWTLKDAEEATQRWKEHGKSHPTPLSQWAVWNRELPALESSWRLGEGNALLEALNLCGRFRLPLPGWCAVAVAEAAEKITSFQSRTWDEAFDVSALSKRKLPQLHREWENRIPLIMQIIDALNKENPPKVTTAIKLAAGKHDVSFELARRWYYDHIKIFPESSTLTSRGWIKHKTNKPLKSNR